MKTIDIHAHVVPDSLWKAIEAAGGEVVELTPGARAEFIRAIKPLHDEARKRFGDEVFALLGK